MDFTIDFSGLEVSQQEHFRAVVSRLLAGQVLTPGSPLRPDPDWRFAVRYQDLIDSYLRIGGWRFEVDLGLRLCRAVHERGEQRVRFNKLESLILCMLRLIYHEQMQQAAEEARCDVQVGALRERLIQSGRPAGQLQRRAVAEAIRRLARHSLVEIDRGFAGEDGETFVVTALMERVLPPDRIAALAELVRAYSAGRTGSGAPSEDAPQGADPADEGEGEEGPS